MWNCFVRILYIALKIQGKVLLTKYEKHIVYILQIARTQHDHLMTLQNRFELMTIRCMTWNHILTQAFSRALRDSHTCRSNKGTTSKVIRSIEWNHTDYTVAFHTFLPRSGAANNECYSLKNQISSHFQNVATDFKSNVFICVYADLSKTYCHRHLVVASWLYSQ